MTAVQTTRVLHYIYDENGYEEEDDAFLYTIGSMKTYIETTDLFLLCVWTY